MSITSDEDNAKASTTQSTHQHHHQHAALFSSKIVQCCASCNASLAGCCPRFAEAFHNEFQLGKLSFHHAFPRVFSMPGWVCISRTAFTIYRIVYAVVLIAWISYDFSIEYTDHYQDKPAMWLIYATNWSFILLCVSAICMAMLAVVDNFKNKNEAYSSKYRFCWFLYGLAANCMVTCCLVYYFALVNRNTLDFKKTVFSSTQSKLKHSLNALAVLLDFAISAVPLQLLHVVYVLCAGLVYIAFNIIYRAAGGTGPQKRYIYAQLDWSEHAGWAVAACFVIMITAVLIQLLGFLAYYWRRHLQTLANRRLAGGRWDFCGGVVGSGSGVNGSGLAEDIESGKIAVDEYIPINADNKKASRQKPKPMSSSWEKVDENSAIKLIDNNYDAVNANNNTGGVGGSG